MQNFLRPDHVIYLEEGPSPSSALMHLTSLAVLPTVLQSHGKFLLVGEFQ